VEVVATAKRVRVSPRKARLVLDVIRGKRVDEALAILSFLPSPVARTVSKIVKSAAANAENNFQMAPDRLRIVKTFADGGQTLRRYHAGARGRVNPFRRRYSHITVIVEEE